MGDCPEKARGGPRLTFDGRRVGHSERVDRAKSGIPGCAADGESPGSPRGHYGTVYNNMHEAPDSYHVACSIACEACVAGERRARHARRSLLTNTTNRNPSAYTDTLPIEIPIERAAGPRASSSVRECASRPVKTQEMDGYFSPFVSTKKRLVI